MKKVFVVSAVALMAVGFTSCKKDYTCDCTIGSLTSSSPINDAKKADAEDACDALDTAAKIADSSASCTLN